MEPTSYPGSCHCGAVRYAFTTALAPDEWSVRACQCSFCVTRGALSVSDPAGRLEFTAAEDDLTRYRFGLKTADFLICAKCGTYVGALIETANGLFAIANTRTLDPIPDDIAEPMPMDYDAEDTGARVNRRERIWTPAGLRSLD